MLPCLVPPSGLAPVALCKGRRLSVLVVALLVLDDEVTIAICAHRAGQVVGLKT